MPGSRQPPVELECSFCGKSEGAVKKLVAGPGVYICDECVELANGILEAEFPTDTVRARRKTLEQVAHDFKRLVDSQEQLVIEQRRFSEKYDKLLDEFLVSPDTGGETD